MAWDGELMARCDKCGEPMSDASYERQTGLCLFCVREIQ